MDVERLQTAASIEQVIVTLYGRSLDLPFIGGASANPFLKAFVTRTRDQHAAHAAAFNAALGRLGAKPQPDPDPVLGDVVDQAEVTLTGPGPVVDLALKLETAAAATYVTDLSALDDPGARRVTATIAGIQAQHVAVLSYVKALLDGNAPDLVALDPAAAPRVPPSAVTAALPASAFPTSEARPPDEGAVR